MSFQALMEPVPVEAHRCSCGRHYYDEGDYDSEDESDYDDYYEDDDEDFFFHAFSRFMHSNRNHPNMYEMFFAGKSPQEQRKSRRERGVYVPHTPLEITPVPGCMYAPQANNTTSSTVDLTWRAPPWPVFQNLDTLYTLYFS